MHSSFSILYILSRRKSTRNSRKFQTLDRKLDFMENITETHAHLMARYQPLTQMRRKGHKQWDVEA